MKRFFQQNQETIKYLFVIIGIIWLILIILTIAGDLYKQLFKVDANDGTITVLEKVGSVANNLLDLVVPLVLIVVGLVIAPFVTGAALIVAAGLVVIGLIGVVSSLFGWFGKGSSNELGGTKIDLK